MADRRPAEIARDEIALETALVELGGAIRYPVPSGDLAAAVGERLRRERPPRERVVLLGRRPFRASALLAAALVLLAVAAVAAGVLGLPGIRIVLGPGPSSTASPVASPAASANASTPGAVTPTPTPGPPGSALGLGQPIAPATVDAAAGRHVPIPAALGPAATAWLDRTLGQPIVTLVWRPGPALPDTAASGAPAPTGIGAVLTAIPATIEADYLEKFVGQGGVVERVTVAGHRGFWIGGAPHEVFLLDPSGRPIESTARLVGSSLLWEQDGLTLRLETGLDKAGALALASTAR